MKPSENKPDTKNEQYLVTQRALAGMLKVSPQAVNKLCRVKFQPAFVGRKLDANHPVIREHFDEKGAVIAAMAAPEPKKEKPKKKNSKPRAPNKPTCFSLPSEAPEPAENTGQPPVIVTPTQRISFEEIENLTVCEVVERHGTIAGFKLYVDTLRITADWKNKELKYITDRGKLVEFNPLADSLFALVNLAFKRVVGEFPGSVAPQLKAIVLSSQEDSIVKMRELMEKELSQIIKSCKTKIIRDIKKAKDKIKV